MEKRKFMKKSIVALVCVLVLASMVFTMVACDNKDEDLPTITIETEPEPGAELNAGDEVVFLVSISDNSPYTVYVDNEKLAKISGKKLQILKAPAIDTEINLTVRVNRLSNLSKSVKFVVKAPSVLPTLTMSSKTASGTKLKEGDEVTINAAASDGSEVLLSVSDTKLASVSGNIVSIISTPEYTTPLTITASLKDYPDITRERKYYVSAAEKDGEIKGKDGNVLTTDLLKALGNESITVSGTVTDYYIDTENTANSLTTVYNTKVMMAEGAWYGEWYADGSQSNLIYDNYRKGDTADYTYVNNDGEVTTGGHALERIYIDKNNTVQRKVESDSMSNALVWENQHLWNHIAEMATDISSKFIYDAVNDVFTYEWYIVENSYVVVKDQYDYYLMTYLSYSLTPFLDDTLDSISFKMENGEITKLMARTETQTGDNKVAYTEVSLNFSDIGTTTVPEPTKYKEGENTVLANAIEKMKNANNYTFSAKEIATTSPTVDEDDYNVSASASASFPTLTNNGTVGLVGRITSDKILLKRTGEYQQYDDYQYWIEYTGYNQVSADKYDYFKYDASAKKLVGTKKYSGTIADVIPQWDFSADVFKWVGSRATLDSNGQRVEYSEYVLRDSQIIGEIAKEFSMHSNANSTVASSKYQLSILVDLDGNVVSTSYPYEYGGWFGYVETTYSDVGTTAFTDEFDGYEERVLPDWSDLSTDSYWYKHTSNLEKYGCYNENATGSDKYHKYGVCDHKATFDKIIKDVYNMEANQFISMNSLREIFGDSINAFFGYKSETLTDGTTAYTDYINLTAQAPAEYLDDKNNLQAGFGEFFDKIKTVLQNAGFTYNAGVSDITGGERGTSDRKMVFSSDKLTIAITNNHTRHCWIYIYNYGDYPIA